MRECCLSSSGIMLKLPTAATLPCQAKFQLELHLATDFLELTPRQGSSPEVMCDALGGNGQFVACTAKSRAAAPTLHAVRRDTMLARARCSGSAGQRRAAHSSRPAAGRSLTGLGDCLPASLVCIAEQAQINKPTILQSKERLKSFA